jgi:hypothetical protein
MGSSTSGLYHGTGEKSQPYSPKGYHVDTPMLEHDKIKGTYSNKDGYQKNPTSVKAADAIKNNKVYIEGKVANGQYTYVVDKDGDLVFGKRNGSKRFQTPHPSLIGGKDPVVKMAGMVDIRNGKIFSWDDRSGHYKPNSESKKFADKAFGKLPKSVFVKRKKKGNK